MARLYPELVDHVTMTVYDVGQKILASFDANLSDYAMKRFERKGIRLRLRKP
jgi:NADH dehydrogenase